MIENPLLAPLFPIGKGPLPPGMTEEDRANMMQMKKYQDNMTAGMESCVVKTTVAGAFGMSALTLFLHIFLYPSLRFCCWWILFHDVFVVRI
jgi:import inner membrane translocase subunit TIM22